MLVIAAVLAVPWQSMQWVAVSLAVWVCALSSTCVPRTNNSASTAQNLTVALLPVGVIDSIKVELHKI